MSQIIVGHRGASADAPENTLAAFRLAWEQRSDGIEGDFYLTADRQIVCIHDRDTERTTGVKRMVEQSTLQQLRRLDYGKWKDPRFAGEPIPTLDEVFQTVPDGKTFVIELKTKQQIVPVLCEQLRSLPTERVELLIISFDQETVKACKTLLPGIRAHWLTGMEQIKEPGKAARNPTADEIAAVVRQTSADGVGMKGRRGIIDAPFVAALRAAGSPEFHVWTVDSVEDARYFRGLGASGITTNVPGVLREALWGEPEAVTN